MAGSETREEDTLIPYLERWIARETKKLERLRSLSNEGENPRALEVAQARNHREEAEDLNKFLGFLEGEVIRLRETESGMHDRKEKPLGVREESWF